ncbi:MAG: c-type cytochrome [Gammaproteobacteria bacterium]|nr:c-type cytochrome [Gammaproteobacteria bacterium]
MHHLLLFLFLLSPNLVGLTAAGVEVTADLDNGADINELCAGCHGEYGQGGSEGEYPRLAGQPESFIIAQMHLFRDRKRPNMAMLEYVDERQMPDQDIIDIAAYLSRITLPTRLPPLKQGAEFDALARLEMTRKLLNIPRIEGDFKAGEDLYRKECQSCHGRDGAGNHRYGVPLLTGQYSNYLQRQVEKYRKGVRIHDPEDPTDRLLNEFSDNELHNLFAFLSIADDP